MSRGRRRRLATIAATVIALGTVGLVLVSEVATAAGASAGSSVAPTTTGKTVRKVTRKRKKLKKVTHAHKALKVVRHHRKTRRRKVVHVARSTTTTSTTPKSTTSTTVAHKLAKAGGFGRGRRAGLGGGAIAAQPVSARHSGVSTSTLILILLGLAPLILLGFGLVGADISTRSRRRTSVTMPT